MECTIDPRWRTSSHSGNGGGNCVEVADHGSRVLVKDTKARLALGSPWGGGQEYEGGAVRGRLLQAVGGTGPGTWSCVRRAASRLQCLR
jgi:Domain of unknown function (DUF397)